MRTLHAVGCLLLLVVATQGCWKTKRNPLYCDDSGAYLCADPALPFCDLAKHECLVAPPSDLGVDAAPDLTPMCLANTGCADATKPICDDTQKTCRACVAGTPSADCAAFTGRPVCATSGSCVECVNHQDCAAAGKSCQSSTSTCVPCQANADCASGACRADHVCAAATDILYVDNKNGTCTGSHAGTMGDPFCQVAPALTATGSTIYVVGSNTDYDAISVLTAVDKAIVGPGRSAAAVATFAQNTKDGIVLAPATGTAKLSVAGVVITGLGAGARGVSCNQTGGTSATLIIARSTITGSAAHAVDVNGCTVTLDANELTLNTGGGIQLTGASYTVTNNIIVGNGNNTTATVPGFVVNAASTGTFAYNTVVKNQVVAGVGGLDCSAAAHAISSSIVVQNTALVSTQFAGSCTLTNVVAGASETASGATKLDPAFVSTSNFRLDVTAGAPVTANQACCIDKIDSGTTDHDVDGTHRPIRPKWDIGAFEAP